MKKIKSKPTPLRLKKDLKVRYIYDAAEYYSWSLDRYERFKAQQAALEEQEQLDDLRRRFQQRFITLKG